MRADKRGLLRRAMAAILTMGLFTSLCLTASASAPAETAADAPKETSVETSSETPEETSAETAAEAHEETSAETSAETPEETSAETSAETPEETPEGKPAEASAATAVATPAETPAAMPETAQESKDDETLPVYFDGLMYARARMKDGMAFVSPQCVCRFLGLDMNWSADAKTMSLIVQGIELSAEAGREYMTVEGRYLYEPEGWMVADGELYLPVNAIEKLFNVTIRENQLPHTLEINTGNAALITGGEDYYELNFPIEDLFWLAQIIYSESYQQPLAGQIGVGNVVANRVASKDFPNSVFDVVFDIEGVVQFEPVSTGGIYVTPDEVSQIAARLCLEGYNTVGDSLYFVNPSKGSFWFDNTLDFVVAIGEHNFYK